MTRGERKRQCESEADQIYRAVRSGQWGRAELAAHLLVAFPALAGAAQPQAEGAPAACVALKKLREATIRYITRGHRPNGDGIDRGEEAILRSALTLAGAVLASDTPVVAASKGLAEARAAGRQLGLEQATRAAMQRSFAGTCPCEGCQATREAAARIRALAAAPRPETPPKEEP